MFWSERFLFLLLGLVEKRCCPSFWSVFYPVVIVSKNSHRSTLADTGAVVVRAGILERREKQFSFFFCLSALIKCCSPVRQQKLSCASASRLDGGDVEGVTFCELTGCFLRGMSIPFPWYLLSCLLAPMCSAGPVSSSGSRVEKAWMSTGLGKPGREVWDPQIWKDNELHEREEIVQGKQMLFFKEWKGAK